MQADQMQAHPPTCGHEARMGAQQRARRQDLPLGRLLHGIQLRVGGHAAHAQLRVDVVVLGGAACGKGRVRREDEHRR